jgi:hypothetical protein
MGMILDRYPADHGEFKLALALGNFANEEGRNIYPSVETMAEKSRQDVRSVQRHLKRMLESEWLFLVRPGGGRGRPAVYRINPRWIAGEDLPLIGVKKGDTVTMVGQNKTVTPVSKNGDIGVAAYKNLEEPNTPLPPAGGEDGFQALMAAYPKHRRNLRAARREWEKLDPAKALQQRIVAAAAQQARRADWQAEGGRRVPNLSKWLADEGWRTTHDDEAPVPQTAVIREGGQPEAVPASSEVKNAHLAKLRELQREALAKGASRAQPRT